MKKWTFYNEIEPYCCQWIENLMGAGHISNGDIDARSIKDIGDVDFSIYNRCHFFAGISVWDYAFRLAGWPDHWPVWSGSCPCQPFSGAGKGEGFADDRHLWPDWFKLIDRERPFVVFGEQVASPNGYAWLDVVQTDMEGAGYTFGAVVTPAAGFGAPHGRHRIYWVGYTERARLEGQRRRGDSGDQWSGDAGGLDIAARIGHRAHDLEPVAGRRQCTARQASGAHAEAVADTLRSGREQYGREHGQQPEDSCAGGPAPGPINGMWRGADWLGCRDGYFRPVEPGTFPLADGVAHRVGKLRAYGNAIVLAQAVEFIKAVKEEIYDKRNGLS
jgi:DNA (cytosine-5)-methyltransferase 1